MNTPLRFRAIMYDATAIAVIFATPLMPLLSITRRHIADAYGFH
jgi:hypothetical protein